MRCSLISINRNAGLSRSLALVLGLFVFADAVPSHGQNRFTAAPSSTRVAIRNAFLGNPSGNLPAEYSGIDSALAFYAARDFEPAWTASETQRQMAGIAIRALASAADEGLRAEDYQGDWRKPPASPDEIVRYELTLTHAVLRFARDLRLGRTTPGALHRDLDLPRDSFSAVADLSSGLRNSALTRFFAGLPPPHPEYRKLRQELSRYRAIAARGGWEKLPPELSGVKFESGDSSLSLLARRLAREDSQLFPFVRSAEELRAALKNFQSRHALNESGELDAATLAALNVPVEERILQIIANMERWRWLPRNLERAYIAVNVPDQSAQYVRGGRAIASSKVVVGRKANPTPLMRTQIEALVVNPPWNVPGFIAARDLLPKLRKNRRYLQTKNMVIVDGPEGDPHGIKVDWRSIEAADFPFAIRQLPGPATALGKLMLDSPNNFDVYLHDTPNKKYFSLPERGLSNGCVRVENIFDFAVLALSEGAGAGSESAAKEALTAAASGKDTARVPLGTPLPVYFLYWTVFAGEDGTLQFREDKYERDAALIAALSGKTAETVAPENDESEDITP